jgi:hypothetical protein
LHTGDKIHPFRILNAGNVTRKKIVLGYKDYSLMNFFFIGTWNLDFYKTEDFEVFTALFINIRVLWNMVNQHGTINKIMQYFL